MIQQDQDLRWEPLTQWKALNGKWSFKENEIEYTGPNASPAIQNPYGLSLSSERLSDGSAQVGIVFHASLPMKGESAGIVLGYHSQTSNYIIVGLGAFEFAFAIWEFDTSLGWRPLATAGSIENLEAGREYLVTVTERGQRISLVVDAVPILEYVLPHPLVGNQLGLFTFARSSIQFRNCQVRRRKPSAFVAMPFSEPYDTLYRSVIRPKASNMGFDVVRIDEVARPGIIFEDIQRQIEDAKVVIAEITAPNQNVFYELGYAHALHKPTILLAQRNKDPLPFDISSYRVIFYDDSIGGKPAVERSLRQHLDSILQEY